MKSRLLPWLCLFIVIQVGRVAVADELSPLADYVSKPDDSYKWVKRREGEANGTAFVELTLTSQTWRDIVWRHQLFIIKPKQVRNPSQALLMITGGGWRDELAEPIADNQAQLPKEGVLFSTLAKEIGAPVAVLLHVPQQPIFGGMTEDEIISYTFEEFLKTKDTTWPLLSPMVKSAVRGMDAVQEYTGQEWSLPIKSFTVTGASKRGWTTWLTAAVDSRVQAIAPMVIDVLNMAPQMQHQLNTWGKFSEEIEDYTKRGIQSKTSTKEGDLLRAIVDPYSYRDVLVQPKMILLGTNDRYWTLDALNLYWGDLIGEKHVLYVPNQGHGLRDVGRVLGSIAAIHRQAAGELKLANLNWDLEVRGDRLQLNMHSDPEPAEVQAWIATAPTRDFRDAKWNNKPIKSADGDYVHGLPLPKEGYAAMFGEAIYKTDRLPYYLSTNLKIVGPEGEVK